METNIRYRTGSPGPGGGKRCIRALRGHAYKHDCGSPPLVTPIGGDREANKKTLAQCMSHVLLTVGELSYLKLAGVSFLSELLEGCLQARFRTACCNDWVDGLAPRLAIASGEKTGRGCGKGACANQSVDSCACLSLSRDLSPLCVYVQTPSGTDPGM